MRLHIHSNSQYNMLVGIHSLSRIWCVGLLISGPESVGRVRAFVHAKIQQLAQLASQTKPPTSHPHTNTCLTRTGFAKRNRFWTTFFSMQALFYVCERRRRNLHNSFWNLCEIRIILFELIRQIQNYWSVTRYRKTEDVMESQLNLPVNRMLSW